MTTILDELASEPHIIEIIVPEDITSCHISPSIWTPEHSSDNVKYASHMIDYLNMPIIVDDFKCRDKRKAWSEILSPEMRTAYDNNAIRFSPMYGISSCTYSFGMGYLGQKPDVLANHLKNLRDNVPSVEDYNILLNGFKKRIVGDIRQNINNILDLLSVSSKRTQ